MTLKVDLYIYISTLGTRTQNTFISKNNIIDQVNEHAINDRPHSWSHGTYAPGKVF